MISLLYRSSATAYPTEIELIELLKDARVKNQSKNITGMLLYDRATYLQVLEGAEEDVHEIYNSILKDKRNNGHFKLIEEKITHRNFPNWSMGFKDLKTCSPNELVGFQDIFNGVLDKELAVKNASNTLSMLKRFAKMT